MKIKRKCRTCGKGFWFISSPYNIKKGKGVFCSVECRPKRIKRKCIICGKQFKIWPSRIKIGKGKICSLRCAGVAKRGKNNVLWTGGEAERICQVCGKKFHVRKWVVEKGQGIVCSTKCKGKITSNRMKGKRNHNWKGGITDIRASIRASLKYKEWRQGVFIRDGFTCQKCGNNCGGDLEAHHIKSFHKLLEEIKDYMPLLSLYDAAMIYTPLWNINNGITLCEKCHSHSKRK